MTGRAPADTGIAGDEFFVREENRFYAPIPLSSRDSSDYLASIDDDLLGKILRVPTVYQQIKGSSDVSLLYVYHGASIYSTPGGTALFRVLGGVIKGAFAGETLRQSIAAPIDDGSISQVLDVLHKHDIPGLLVVYFPGVDIYAHGSPDPLPAQTEYLERTIDPAVGRVLDAYSERGALADTYVIFTADHGHTPVLRDSRHDIGVSELGTPFDLLRNTGFRVRKPGVKLPPAEQDYQAVVADDGFSSYLYLADRSTCLQSGQRCDWRRPPRFVKDVLPVLRALYSSNGTGRPIAGLKDTLDLIFSRDPGSGSATNAPPFEIFNGQRLVPIHAYLSEHPRPDLVDVERRMRWLSEGPYGNRAGDIMLMAKAGMALPIQDRYYFSYATYYAWHGSLTLQDSHIPLVIAKKGASGEALKGMVDKVVGNPPSALDVTPLIVSLMARGRRLTVPPRQ
jgi:hypothetical protein